MSKRQQIEPYDQDYFVHTRTNRPPDQMTDTRIRKRTWRRRIERLFARPAQDRTFLERKHFLRILGTERRRSERSGKPFTLVLLRIADMLESPAPETLVVQLQRGLFSAIRETDVAGWYDPAQTVVRIILTEIVEPDQKVAAAILKRTTKAIGKAAAPQYAAKINISCHICRDRGRHIDNFEAMIVDPDVVLYRR